MHATTIVTAATINDTSRIATDAPAVQQVLPRVLLLRPFLPMLAPWAASHTTVLKKDICA
jgi:hypothetical protein